MTVLLDVVNFNADASCLASQVWLDALRGGSGSRMCQWLGAYVESRRKVVLGIVGASVADLRAMNPEAIALINANGDVFEIVVRPFAHDVALLRSPQGFNRNLALGQRIIAQTFERVTPFYLPAEFMMSNSQVHQAAKASIGGLFINPDRFSPVVRRCIPEVPYIVRGALGSTLRCIPLRGRLTRAYLDALHEWSAEPWNRALAGEEGGIVGSWRDGESWLLLPNGEAREQAWLAEEEPAVSRAFVREVLDDLEFTEPDMTRAHGWCYPVHSFDEWFKESRMLGFLQRLQRVEAELARFDTIQTSLWLQSINSDVLSSVEKDSPVIQIRPRRGCLDKAPWTIWRSARGFEGEEFLSLLERFDPDFDVCAFIQDNPGAHMHKLRARHAFLASG
jgi:hypothetical protein